MLHTHTQAPTPPKSLNKYCLSWGQVIPVGLNIPDSPSLAPKRESSNFGELFFFQKKWSAWFRVILAWNAKFTREILSLPVKFRYPSVTGELLVFVQTNLPHGGRLVFLVHLATAIMHKTALHCYNYLYHLVSCKPGRKKNEKTNHAPLSQFHIGDCNIKLASFICLWQFLWYIFPMCSHLVIFSPLRKGLDHGSWVASASWTGSTT